MAESLLASLAADIAAASTKKFAVWLAIAAPVTAALLIAAFRNWRWVRMIEDIPTSRARSAHQGYVELQGTAELMDGPPIRTPVSKRDCVWWSLTVEERHGDSWRRKDREVSDELFALRDETGTCVIDPEGANVTAPHRRVTMSGSPKIAAARTEGRYRNVERFIAPHDRLYVIGQYRTHKGIDHWDSEAELREKLREWKRDQDTLLRRFDEDRDGRIDQAEWAAARRAARAEVRREHREASVQPGVSVLCAPADGRPFLIAGDDQEQYLRRLRRVAAATGVLSAAGTLVVIGLLVARFGG